MTLDQAPAPPVPQPDPDSAPYWQALREHRVVVQRCAACGVHHFPPTPGCPHCGHPDVTWVEVPATGTVYSYVTVHRAFDPAFADQVPYVIATVDLDCGARVIGRLTGPAAIDARVEGEFADHPEWTELRFRVAAASS
ncbi:hypothetical protein SAMN05443637_11041 [Pseudonocardia thermophila]|jgi:Predicted nucleic-acid-binding protein containing a Zn-ribbon|uniref:Rubredoxin-like zinc ribbon domain n=1 Tax=Pseudonocardia thermophila TaxID=1848 RepID=A0A1M6UF76_PSETH|nr:Zn-ribbon domain-containing OB-fold protein [Pseudonocardia thermophila]SHK67864.1 hypothetical protein SAMN05443637_11041 [Pseudonocardia thermophila]